VTKRAAGRLHNIQARQRRGVQFSAMSQGGGKVGGLTRPGSKIPVADSASARSSRSAAKSKSSVDDVDVSKCGQALVGRQVRKLFGRNGYFDGEITHYVPDQEVYRVRHSSVSVYTGVLP